MHSYAVKYSPPTDHLTLTFDHLCSSGKQRTSAVAQMEKWLMGEMLQQVWAWEMEVKDWKAVFSPPDSLSLLLGHT